MRVVEGDVLLQCDKQSHTSEFGTDPAETVLLLERLTSYKKSQT